MNLASSLKAFRELWSEDAQLALLGARRGALLRLHYEGRWAARCGLPPKSSKLRFTLNGKPVDLELSAPYEGAFKGVFLDQEYDCSKLLSAPPQRILDLGANIGMASIHLANQFPDAEFLCVEPDPRNLHLLERNLRTNAVRHTVVPAAVGAVPGTLNLRFGDNPTCSALESSPMHNLRESTTVKVTTVPQLLLNAGWATVDLVKIDIEGSEDEILAINNQWLAQVSALILEIHPNTTPEKIASYVNPYRFSLRRIGSGREPVYVATREVVL